MSDYLPPFELDGRLHLVTRMLALWIAEHLDVIEHTLPCLFTHPLGSAPDLFALERFIVGWLVRGLVDVWYRSAHAPQLPSRFWTCLAVSRGPFWRGTQ